MVYGEKKKILIIKYPTLILGQRFVLETLKNAFSEILKVRLRQL